MVGTVSDSNGNSFSWRIFLLSFLTRKFVIAVAVQVIATLMAYYAIDLIQSTAMNAKEHGTQVVKIFEIWCYFTASNAAAFGLFNNASKMANASMEKAKNLLGSNGETPRR